jgi:hypothetical protein
MTIVYALISVHENVLAEHTATSGESRCVCVCSFASTDALFSASNSPTLYFSILATGNFPTVTRVLLAKIPQQDGKMTYQYDAYNFHYVGKSILCVLYIHIVHTLFTRLCLLQSKAAFAICACRTNSTDTAFPMRFYTT